MRVLVARRRTKERVRALVAATQRSGALPHAANANASAASALARRKQHPYFHEKETRALEQKKRLLSRSRRRKRRAKGVRRRAAPQRAAARAAQREALPPAVAAMAKGGMSRNTSPLHVAMRSIVKAELAPLRSKAQRTVAGLFGAAHVAKEWKWRATDGGYGSAVDADAGAAEEPAVDEDDDAEDAVAGATAAAAALPAEYAPASAALIAAAHAAPTTWASGARAETYRTLRAAPGVALRAMAPVALYAALHRPTAAFAHAAVIDLADAAALRGPGRASREKIVQHSAERDWRALSQAGTKVAAAWFERIALFVARALTSECDAAVDVAALLSFRGDDILAQRAPAATRTLLQLLALLCAERQRTDAIPAGPTDHGRGAATGRAPVATAARAALGAAAPATAPRANIPTADLLSLGLGAPRDEDDAAARAAAQRVASARASERAEAAAAAAATKASYIEAAADAEVARKRIVATETARHAVKAKVAADEARALAAARVKQRKSEEAKRAAALEANAAAALAEAKAAQRGARADDSYAASSYDDASGDEDGDSAFGSLGAW